MYDNIIGLLEAANKIGITRMSQIIPLAKLFNAGSPLSMSALLEGHRNAQVVMNASVRRLCDAGYVRSIPGLSVNKSYRAVILPELYEFRDAAKRMTWSELRLLGKVTYRHDLTSSYRWLAVLFYVQEPTLRLTTGKLITELVKGHKIKPDRMFLSTLGAKCLPHNIPLIKEQNEGGKRFYWVPGPGYKTVIGGLKGKY